VIAAVPVEAVPMPFQSSARQPFVPSLNTVPCLTTVHVNPMPVMEDTNRPAVLPRLLMMQAMNGLPSVAGVMVPVVKTVAAVVSPALRRLVTVIAMSVSPFL
jgi:hypothetical protein